MYTWTGGGKAAGFQRLPASSHASVEASDVPELFASSFRRQEHGGGGGIRLNQVDDWVELAESRVRLVPRTVLPSGLGSSTPVRPSHRHEEHTQHTYMASSNPDDVPAKQQQKQQQQQQQEQCSRSAMLRSF